MNESIGKGLATIASAIVCGLVIYTTGEEYGAVLFAFSLLCIW